MGYTRGVIKKSHHDLNQLMLFVIVQSSPGCQIVKGENSQLLQVLEAELGKEMQH